MIYAHSVIVRKLWHLRADLELLVIKISVRISLNIQTNILRDLHTHLDAEQ